MDSVRIDKWLWAARFFKTRSLAQQALEKGRVLLDQSPCKSAMSLRVGQTLSITIGETTQIVEVQSLSDVRRSAPQAQQLYRETAQSLEDRTQARERRRLMTEPAREIVGRPTKRDRRKLSDLTG